MKEQKAIEYKYILEGPGGSIEYSGDLSSKDLQEILDKVRDVRGAKLQIYRHYRTIEAQ